MSLLKLAEPVATRLKCLVMGDAGTGKTITALSFPNPAVVDAEDGTLHYGKYKKFHRISTNDITIIKSVIDELLADPQGFKTFVVDPFNMVYDALVNKIESRMKVKTGNPAYTIQPIDYKFVKSEVRSFINKLLSLDMNIIVTTGVAVEYAKEGFMQATGKTKPEGPKAFDKPFDVVLELYFSEDGKRMAKVRKDRTNSLPPVFEYTYEPFVEYIGIEGLEREPILINQKAALDHNTGRNTIIKFNGMEIKTAGVTAENLEILQELSLEIGEEELQAKIREDYLTDSPLDLKNDEADLLIKDIKALISNRQ
jgi:hypothetical protein